MSYLDHAGEELPTFLQILCDDLDVPLTTIIRHAEQRIMERLSPEDAMAAVEYKWNVLLAGKEA